MRRLYVRRTAGASPAPRQRAGFTLIELIVVITLLLTLMALVVAFLPRVQERARAASGASQLQGWLMIAKTRAVREQAVRGVRLVADPTNPNYVREVFYLEIPDDFVVPLVAPAPAVQGIGNFQTPTAPPALATAPFSVVWIRNLNISSDVQPNDYLQLFEGGQPRRIIAVTPRPFMGPALPMRTELTITPPLPSAVTQTRSYRIMRAPRITAEEPNLLPDGVVIDLSTNRLPPPPSPGPNGFSNLNPLPAVGDIDILFAPSGKVITPALGSDFLALWVRDTTGDDPAATTPQKYFAGEPTILAIYLRTGIIAPNDPDETPDAVIPGWLQDPYAFFRDGRNSTK